MNFLQIFRPKTVVTTHDGTFHADDVFAVATLSLWAEKQGRRIKIVRTRDVSLIAKSDIVLDVGMVYDPQTKRFDHHQKEGAGERENKIPYASFGLIWKHYGGEICSSQDVVKKIEQELVMQIDAYDNGVNIAKVTYDGVSEYSVAAMIYSFNTSYIEDFGINNKQFYKALYFAKEIIKRKIAHAEASVLGFSLTNKLIQEQGEPEILILGEKISWGRAVSQNKKIKLVISKVKTKAEWHVEVARDDLNDFNSNRVEFPISWRGLSGVDLQKESGVKDVMFCTNGGWLTVAGSKEGAIEIAKKALEKNL